MKSPQEQINRRRISAEAWAYARPRAICIIAAFLTLLIASQAWPAFVEATLP